MANQEYLTIKEAAQLCERSEQTIRRLVKQHVLTSHIRSEDTPKGRAYQISRVLLEQEYQLVTAESFPVSIIDDALQMENCQLREDIVERDQIIKQLQHRLFEQAGLLNALTMQLNSQVTSQKMTHIEDMLLQQNAHLEKLQQQLFASKDERLSPNQRSLWRRLFGI